MNVVTRYLKSLMLAELVAGMGVTMNFSGSNLGAPGNANRVYFAIPTTAIGTGVLGPWAIANRWPKLW